jgi:hypothetical protein
MLSTLNWWITNGILLDNSTDSNFFLLTPLDDTPYRRMGMSYQVEELLVPALAHVVGSGITVDCGIMYNYNYNYNYTMCLTSRMELTGWYYRDQDVTKQCVLLHVWS